MRLRYVTSWKKQFQAKNHKTAYFCVLMQFVFLGVFNSEPKLVALVRGTFGVAKRNTKQKCDISFANQYRKPSNA
jgi:hypothetical protein